MKRGLLVVIGAIILLFFMYAVWPTPYFYKPWVNKGLVRINRITGTADRLTTGGWEKLRENTYVSPDLDRRWRDHAK
jgi:hypothetical protein